jgi:hypothetical protein
MMKVHPVAGSSKQHDPPGGNKIIAARMAVVRDLVR